MSIRIAINGFGRIGRNVLRALYESDYRRDMEIIAINDLGDPEVLAHLTQYDTAHGRFNHTVTATEYGMLVDQDAIRILSEKDPAKLPWKELDIDIVFECTGLFTDGHKAKAHLQAGARDVLISAPGKNVDNTVVYGVNEHSVQADQHIISNASCTTNCLAPMAKALHQQVGIKHGMMTTVHAFTNDQTLTDMYHSDVRRARSATQSMIPTKTGAAAAVGLVLPELKGKLDGLAVRVPTINVSLVDFTFVANRATSVDDINGTMRRTCHQDDKGVITFNQAPLVSVDFNHNPASCVFDSTQTRVDGDLVKVMAWYDNEWGFSHRMLDMARVIQGVQSASGNSSHVA